MVVRFQWLAPNFVIAQMFPFLCISPPAQENCKIHQEPICSREVLALAVVPVSDVN